MEAVLLLGTNLNDKISNLVRARKNILERIGSIECESETYRTAPWGNTEQDDFLNKVIVVNTKLSPEKLLEELLDIEKDMGRIRTVKWAPRLIDLDILYFGDSVVNQPGLTIPHPSIQDRRFVLVPLAEILPEFIHPVHHLTNAELLAGTADISQVFLHENGK